MVNLFSGGALSRFGIFAMGIMPYISASIIMQMASHIVPSLQQLRKEGEQGRRQIVKYTRWGTVAASQLPVGRCRIVAAEPAWTRRTERGFSLPDHGNVLRSSQARCS